MTFDEYAEQAGATAIYPDRGNNLVYPTLGLTGEAGEVSEKVKKLIRDNNGKITDQFTVEVKKELGDVLWYIAALSHELGFSMNDVAETNITKLRARQETNKLKGSGDNR